MLKLTFMTLVAAGAIAATSGAGAQSARAPSFVEQGQLYGGEQDPTLSHTSSTGPDFSQGELILVSGGCGPSGWRGRWGHCHYARNWGPGWGSYYGPVRWNGCPPGYWRGPWGHCRNTPYHGRLPGGGWKS